MDQNTIQLADGTQLDAKVVKVMRALKSAERDPNQDPYTQVGDGGTSQGAYQFHNNNWSNWAKQYLGDANAPMTPANQNKLMYYRIKEQKDAGLQPDEIAAIHNGAHLDQATGRYTYNNPAYGEKFRSALLNNSSGSQPKSELGKVIDREAGYGSDFKSDIGKFGKFLSKLPEELKMQTAPDPSEGMGLLNAAGDVGKMITDPVLTAAKGYYNLAANATPVMQGNGQHLLPTTNEISKNIAKSSVGKTIGNVQGGLNKYPEFSRALGSVGSLASGAGILTGGADLLRNLSGQVSPAVTTAKTLQDTGAVGSPEDGAEVMKNLNDLGIKSISKPTDMAVAKNIVGRSLADAKATLAEAVPDTVSGELPASMQALQRYTDSLQRTLDTLDRVSSVPTIGNAPTGLLSKLGAPTKFGLALTASQLGVDAFKGLLSSLWKKVLSGSPYLSEVAGSPSQAVTTLMNQGR